jgi:hypothetical protein
MTAEYPSAIPWYNSTVLRGILTIVVTQAVSRVQAQYHIDFTVLGLGVNEIVAWIMDVISAAALAYMAHGRVTQKASSIITGTQSAADQINVDNPSGAPHVTPTTGPVTPPPM